jgi:hypothetical protein
MLLEVLERVICLEIFPFGKWHYTECPNVDILLFSELRKHGIAQKDVSPWNVHFSQFSRGYVSAYHPESRPGVST